MSPVESLKAYYDAINRKDIETEKKYLSRGSIQKIVEDAPDKGMTIDQILKRRAEAPTQMQTPEFESEKINGDTATVEYKESPNQPLVTVQMVKEDGIWKLAFDKMVSAPSK